MRLGCSGCLTTLVILGLLVVVGAFVWSGSRALQDPRVTATAPTAQDAASAQQKLFRLMRGAARAPVILSEAEVNAVIVRNVDRRDWPFEHPRVLLRADDVVHVIGQVTIRRLLAESPLAVLGAVLPDAWQARPLWLTLAADVQFERNPRSRLRLHVRGVTVGRQRVPIVAFALFFQPLSVRFVHVSLPETVAGVRIESGRAVIRPTSSRERTGAASRREARRGGASPQPSGCLPSSA